jgi:hypothetical protein
VHIVMANNIYNKSFKLSFDANDMFSIFISFKISQNVCSFFEVATMNKVQHACHHCNFYGKCRPLIYRMVNYRG